MILFMNYLIFWCESSAVEKNVDTYLTDHIEDINTDGGTFSKSIRELMYEISSK